MELLDRTFLELVGETGPEAVLLVELERDDPAAAREAVERAAAAVAPWAASVDTGFTAAAAERLWALRHAASPILAGLPESRRSLQVIEDGCVPVERMGEYVRAVREAAAERGLAVVIFGHAGDGHVHVNLLPEIGRSGWEESVASLLEAVTDALIRLGGTPSGEHGDGRLRAGLLARVYGEEIVALFARVKRAFDPLGILNPGVILPSADGAARSAASRSATTPWRCRTTSRAASAASSSGAATPGPGSSWPTASRLTPDPTSHGHPSRAPHHPHRAAAVPRARPPAGPVEGRLQRRRADRRVRRPAVLHEPAQPGGADDGRVSRPTS